jgi:RHS repeat-associated protein
MPSRSWQNIDYQQYRYSFNGKEDDEDFQDYGMRAYCKKSDVFWSVDPIGKAYPFYSPYQYAGNMPIIASDLDGLEPQVETIQKLEYKPVLKAKSFGEVFSNSLHNIVAMPANIAADVLWNGPAMLVNHSINLAYGKYNDVNGSGLLWQLNVETGRKVNGLLDMTPTQHLDAFKDATTNLQNYEIAGSTVLGFWLASPKVKLSSPNTAKSTSVVKANAITQVETKGEVFSWVGTDHNLHALVGYVKETAEKNAIYVVIHGSDDGTMLLSEINGASHYYKPELIANNIKNQLGKDIAKYDKVILYVCNGGKVDNGKNQLLLQQNQYF